MATPGSRGALYRLLQTAVGLSVFALVVLAFGFAVGTASVMAKVNPQKKKPGEVPLPGPTITISDQVYNLGEANHYLKATILLELNADNRSEKQNASLLEEVKRREPQIRDLIIREVSSKTFREVNSPQGKEMLKDELRQKINGLLTRGELKRIMFTSFAVQ
ncbi:MAG: flagellar basal body-associated FliL family protein [Candidatus Coatesbacteria bacterium]